jgi:hypothetical protein
MHLNQDFAFITPPQERRLSSPVEASIGTYTTLDCSVTLLDGTEVPAPITTAVETGLLRPNHTAHHYVPSGIRTEMLCPINQARVIPPNSVAVSCHIAGNYNYGYQIASWELEITTEEFDISGNSIGTSTWVQSKTITEPNTVSTPLDFFVSSGETTPPYVNWVAVDDSLSVLTLFQDPLLLTTGTTPYPFGLTYGAADGVYHRRIIAVNQVNITYTGTPPPDEGAYPGYVPGQSYTGWMGVHAAAITDGTADVQDMWVNDAVMYSDRPQGFSSFDVLASERQYTHNGTPILATQVGLPLTSNSYGLAGLTSPTPYLDFGTVDNGALPIDSTPVYQAFHFGVVATQLNTNIVSAIAELPNKTPLEGALGRPNTNPNTTQISVDAVGEGSAAFVYNTPLPPTGFGTFGSIGGISQGVPVDIGYTYNAVYHSGNYAVGSLSNNSKRVQAVNLSFSNVQNSQIPNYADQYPLTFSAHGVSLYETGVPDQQSGDVFFPDLLDSKFYNKNTLANNVVSLPFKGTTSSFGFGVWSADSATWFLQSAEVEFTEHNVRTQRF